jgi:hypothetical protein
MTGVVFAGFWPSASSSWFLDPLVLLAPWKLGPLDSLIILVITKKFFIMKIEVSELQELLSVIEDNNLSIAEVIEHIKSKETSDEQSKNDEIVLSVDYSRTVQEMINAGKYGWTNDNITEKHFPLPTKLNGKKVSVSTKLFHFNCSISSKDAIAEMDKAGYRPATLAELLALGEKQPELQKEFPIVALGSVWTDAYGGRHVPYLDVDGFKRGLSLDWFGFDWYGNCRFLAVRK